MKSQGELEQIPLKIEKAFSELEQRIMSDIVYRLKTNGQSSATVEWELTRLKQLGESQENIEKWIKEALEISDKELEQMFSETAYEEYYGHKPAYENRNIEQIPFEENKELQQLITAVETQTKETFENITNSLGFAIQDPTTGRIYSAPLTEFYRQTLDAAIYDIHSGTFSYNQVIAKTIVTMTKSGLRWIDYDSGYRSRVEVAARRAVMTGFRQVQGKINEQVAVELNTDTYEVSYHVGARPDHQKWQGRVWTYKQLITVCGLGDVTGLHGANCYHDYNAFIPGASKRTYTDEQLEQMIKEENTPKTYNGKQYTTYQALQQQRKMERAMRKSRQDIDLLQEAGVDEETIILKKAKYQGQMRTYKDFSEKMKLPEQMDRVYKDGLKGKYLPTKTELKKVENTDKGGIMKIPKAKFTNYALNPLKAPDKAKAFQEALGYNLDNCDELIDNINKHIDRNKFVEKGSNEYGTRYEQIIELTGANGKKANVLTAWIEDEKGKRLTSVYVTKKKVKE